MGRYSLGATTERDLSCIPINCVSEGSRIWSRAAPGKLDVMGGESPVALLVQGHLGI